MNSSIAIFQYSNDWSVTWMDKNEVPQATRGFKDIEAATRFVETLLAQ